MRNDSTETFIVDSTVDFVAFNISEIFLKFLNSAPATPNFNRYTSFKLLSCAVVVGDGFVQHDVAEFDLLESVKNGSEVDVYSQLDRIFIPFVPSEYQGGNSYRIIPGFGRETAKLACSCTGQVSMVGVPASLDGVEVPVSIIVKVELDERNVSY